MFEKLKIFGEIFVAAVRRAWRADTELRAVADRIEGVCDCEGGRELSPAFVACDASDADLTRRELAWRRAALAHAGGSCAPALVRLELLCDEYRNAARAMAIDMSQAEGILRAETAAHGLSAATIERARQKLIEVQLRA